MTHHDSTSGSPDTTREIRWNGIYWAVLAYTLVIVVLLYLFSQVFTPDIP